MSDDAHRISLRYKPRSEPRRRIGFTADETLGDVAYTYWRIEEVCSTTRAQWREVGREHITDVSVTAEPVMTDLELEPQTAHNESATDNELLTTAEKHLARAIELSHSDRPADVRAAIREATQCLDAVRNSDAEEVEAE